MAGKLTDAKIQGLKAPEKGQVEHADSMVPGLRVRIGAEGKPSFIIRKRIHGKLHNITLGRYDPRRFGLAAARKRARALISDLEAGAPVPAPKGRASGAPTIRELMPAYLASKEKLRSHAEIKRIADNYIIPAIGDRIADAVTRGEVTAFIDSIDAKAMARAVHAQLSAFYTWALPRLDALPANPCVGAGRPEKPRSRDRVLSDAELAALWRIADGKVAPWGPGVKLLILTAKRRDEVFGADWAEFDLDAGEWIIPPERTKNDRPDIVPLSAPALEVLRSLPKDHAKLFPVRKVAKRDKAGPSGFSKALAQYRIEVDQALDRAPLPLDAQWRLHDIRRTVATGLQRLGVRLEVTEAALNHVSGSRGGIAGVYQRYDWRAEKRAALDAWGGFVLALVGKP